MLRSDAESVRVFRALGESSAERARGSLALAMLCAFAVAALALAGPLQGPGLRKEAAAESRPNVPAPAIELPVVGGGAFRLADATADGWVVLVFFRGMW